VKVAHELARHSTPLLTFGRYAHVEIHDRTKALDALPSIEPVPAQAGEAAATGADGASAVGDDGSEACSAGGASQSHEASSPGTAFQSGDLPKRRHPKRRQSKAAALTRGRRNR
jgi:hypothetical protein